MRRPGFAKVIESVVDVCYACKYIYIKIARQETSERPQTLSQRSLCPEDVEGELGRGPNICVCSHAKRLTRGNFTCSMHN